MVDPGRVLLLGVAVVVLVLSAFGAVYAQAPTPGYPGGVRDVTQWYACYSHAQGSATNYHSTYHAPYCELLDWYAYGLDHSVHGSMSGWVETFEYQTTPSDSVGTGTVAYIVPPDAIIAFQNSCTGSHSYGTASSYAAGHAGVARGTSFGGDGDTFYFNGSGSVEIDDDPVTYYRGTSQEYWIVDLGTRFITDEPVANWSGGSIYTGYPRQYVGAAVQGLGTRFRESSVSCRVVNWLVRGGHDMWYPEDPITEQPEFPFFPPPVAITPIPFTLLTDTHPVLLGITPGDTTCIQPMPEVSLGPVTAFGYTISLESPAYEFCLEEYSVDLELMGFDFGQLLIALAAVGTVGIIYNSIRRGG